MTINNETMSGQDPRTMGIMKTAATQLRSFATTRKCRFDVARTLSFSRKDKTGILKVKSSYVDQNMAYEYNVKNFKVGTFGPTCKGMSLPDRDLQALSEGIRDRIYY